MYYIVLPGTWAHKRPIDWWRRGSMYHDVMRQLGWTHLLADETFWRTDLQGSPLSWFTSWMSPRAPWTFGGEQFAHHLEAHISDPSQLVVVSHSHGGNVVANGLAIYGKPVGAWVSVAMPIRKGVPYDKAREHVGYWLNLHGDWRDRTQWLGTLGDRAFGIKRKIELADRNEGVSGAGHSSIVEDIKVLPRWQGWAREIEKAVRPPHDG
jgi:hypothetical protein